jgi:flagellar assembly protein FliH
VTNNSSKPNAYTRFIPREELGSFASWMPGSFGGRDVPRAATVSATAAVTPPPPTDADWQQRVGEARRQGTQDGYQNGYRDGLVALESFKQSFATQTTAQVGALLRSMEREFDALQPQLAEAVARVAVELARQVLRSELNSNPSVINDVAQQALHALVLSARHVQLHVHPLDVPLVREGAAEALAARSATVSANPALARGDCLVESDLGTLDARIATRWAQAAANLAAGSPWTGIEAEEAPA